MYTYCIICKATNEKPPGPMDKRLDPDGVSAYVLGIKCLKSFVAQLTTQDFADIGARQVIAELDIFRLLVAGQIFSTESFQVVLGQGLVFLDGKQHDGFAGAFIRHANGCRFEHAGGCASVRQDDAGEDQGIRGQG